MELEGTSTANDLTLRHTLQYVNDMAVLMASLHVAQLDWVGTSLGGLIGMLLAGRENSPIRSLVMNDIGPRVNVDAALRIGNDIRRAPRHGGCAAAVRGR
jgi:pimeloyl-ACP methyl ester carboxylesterase